MLLVTSSRPLPANLLAQIEKHDAGLLVLCLFVLLVRAFLSFLHLATVRRLFAGACGTSKAAMVFLHTYIACRLFGCS